MHVPISMKCAFRFNNRKNPYLFRDTLTKTLHSPNVELKELTAQEAEPAA